LINVSNNAIARRQASYSLFIRKENEEKKNGFSQLEYLPKHVMIPFVLKYFWQDVDNLFYYVHGTTDVAL